MTTQRSRQADRAGLPPGTLVFTGEKRVDKSRIAVLAYSEGVVVEKELASPEACRDYLGRDGVTWIDVVGLHDTELLQALGGVLGLHPLVLEDIAHTGQRPQFEDHGDYAFVVVKMLYRGETDEKVVAEQVSFVLGPGYVVTFQEVEGDVFGSIRDRIRMAKGRIRQMGADYLAYALIDSIVDNYFIVLEDVGEQIEGLQEDVINRPGPAMLRSIHGLKRDMIFLRKSLWPLREVVGGLEKSETPLIRDATRVFMRNVYEHTIHVIDTVETLRDTLSGVLEIYLSTVSNRMNETMRLLTVISTVFIPLTFIAGVYGMNFENMPELKWQWGYPGVWGAMVLVAAVMVLVFRRRRWL